MQTLDLDILGLILSALLLLSSSILVAAHTRKSFLDKFWVFVAAVVLQLGSVTTVTSLIHQLSPLAWLITQALIFVVILAGLNYFCGLSIRRSLSLTSVSIPTHPLVMVSSLGIIFLILLTGLNQYFVPISYPSYGDERMYHASRVIYWLQNQTVFPYVTHNDRQIVFTFGGELFFLWPLLFTKTELIARMIFWLGYPLAIVGLYTLLRVLQAGRIVSALGSLVFAATPIVIRHAVGLKPELWLTLFVIGAVFWVVRACRQSDQRGLSFLGAGLFLALSINLKFTALALLPGVLALPWLMGLPQKKLLSERLIILGFVVGLFFSGLVITVGFNLANYGHILGPQPMRQVHASDLSPIQLYTHAVRLPFLLFELPEAPSPTREILTNFGQATLHFLRANHPLPLEKEEGWPGLFVYVMPQHANNFSGGGLIWLPVLAIGLIAFIQDLRSSYPHLQLSPLSLLVMLDLLFLFSIIFLVRWMPHSGLPERFLVAPYTLGLAISGVILSRFISGHKLAQAITLILVVFTVYPSLQLQMDRIKNIISSPILKEQLDWPFAEALNYIPAQARILFVGSQAVADYPLFAPNNGYANQVFLWGKYPFDSRRMQALIETKQITHVLIENDQILDFHWDPPIPTTDMVAWLAEQPNFNEIKLEAGRKRLFETQQQKKIRQAQISQHLEATQAPLPAPLIIIDPSLYHQVGIDPASLKTPWPVEDEGPPEKGFLWLGQAKEGLEGVLWSNDARNVRLRFDVSPPSGQEDTEEYAIQISGLVQGQIMSLEQTFTESTSLTFTVPLRPGQNKFYVKALGKAATAQADNDTRHVFVGLHQVRVESLPQ